MSCFIGAGRADETGADHSLSQRERERLKVLHEAERGHLTQVGAGRRIAD